MPLPHFCLTQSAENQNQQLFGFMLFTTTTPIQTLQRNPAHLPKVRRKRGNSAHLQKVERWKGENEWEGGKEWGKCAVR